MFVKQKSQKIFSIRNANLIFLLVLALFSLNGNSVHFLLRSNLKQLPDPPESVETVPVGITPGYFKVTANGAATYTIPIQVLPGRQRIQPNLAIVYNSRGGLSGPLGTKISLSGFSAITRVGRTRVHDGYLEPITFTRSDRFALDGDRLIEVEGEYGGHETIYKTKNDKFLKIVSFVDDQNLDAGPTRFEVYTKDGSILTYGILTDGRDSGVIKGRFGIRKGWALGEVRDRMDNYMLIEYDHIHRIVVDFVDIDGDGIPAEEISASDRETTELLPLRILYTGNPKGLLYDRFVLFEYDNHPNPRHGYFTGIRIHSTRILTKIHVGTLTDVFPFIEIHRTYELEYETDRFGSDDEFSGRTYLTKVTERGKDGITKPPTKFEWILGQQGFTKYNSEIPAPEVSAGNNYRTGTGWVTNRAISIDVNNDGYMDLMYPYDDKGDSRIHSTWRILLNGGKDFFDENGNYGFNPEAIDTGIRSDEPDTYEDWGVSSETYPLGRVLDYNQDGLMDILLSNQSTNWQVLINSGSNSFELFDTELHAGQLRDHADLYFYKAMFTYLYDINGDGLKDIITRDYFDCDWEDGCNYAWKYRLHDGTAFGSENNLDDVIGLNDLWKDCIKPLFIDLDGDGSTELLTSTGDPDHYTGIKFTDSGHHAFSTNLPYFHDEAWYNYFLIDALDGCSLFCEGDLHGKRFGHIVILDINGDGLKDIIWIRNNVPTASLADSAYYWVNTGRGFLGGDGIWTIFGGSIDIGNYDFRQMALIDYNMDGRDDILVPNIQNDTDENRSGARRALQWSIILSSDSIYEDVVDVGELSVTHLVQQHPIVIDINGDYLPDFLTVQDWNYQIHLNNSETPYVIKKIRDGMIGIDETNEDWNETWTVEIEHIPTTEQMVYSDDNPEILYDEIEPIHDGIIVNRPAMNVVSSYSIDMGKDINPKKFKYKYYDSRYDRLWGWLGFGQVKISIVPSHDEEESSESHLEKSMLLMYGNHEKVNDMEVFPFGYYPYSGIITRQANNVDVEDGSSYLFIDVYDYLHRVTHGGRTYFPYLDFNSTETHFTAANGITTSIAKRENRFEDIDDFGNVHRHTLTLGYGSETNTKIVEIDYEDEVNKWLIGRPRNFTIQWTTADGRTSERVYTIEEYVPDTKLPQKIIRAPGEPEYQQTYHFSYDPYGNIEDSWIEALNTKGIVERRNGYHIMYDHEKIFPYLIRNVYNHTYRYRFNEMGQITVAEDSRGIITRYAYDGFNRLAKIEHMSNDIVIEATPRTEVVDNHSRIVVDVFSTDVDRSLGEIENITYDRLGRVVLIGNRGFDGTMSYSRVKYNENGFVESFYFPQYIDRSEEGTAYYSYNYDNLGRLTSIEDGSQTIKSVEYSGPIVEVTDANEHTKKYHYNTLGQIVTIFDAKDYAWHYFYGKFGLPEQILDPLRNRSIVEYDDYGRVVSWDDPAAITATTYTYSAFDELATLTDANGCVTTHEYDLLGRIIMRSNSCFEKSKFHYDDFMSNTKGLLYKVTSSVISSGDSVRPRDFFEEKFSFNADGLLKKVEKKINGEKYTHEYRYDRFGRLEEHHFPAGPLVNLRITSPLFPFPEIFSISYKKPFGIKYVYNDYGFLKKVQNYYLPRNDFWETLEATAAGQITLEKFGNNLETIYTYQQEKGNKYGLITSIISDAQDIEYSYYNNGNLYQRIDRINGEIETFLYDELDRLTRSSIANESTPDIEEKFIEYDYNEIGNLTYKSDIGTLIYEKPSGRQPHAVTKVEFTDGTIEQFKYDKVGNLAFFASKEKEIYYTSFNKPKQILGPSSGDKLDIEYDAFMNRVLITNGEKSTVYIDGYQKNISDSTSDSHIYDIGPALITRRSSKSSPEYIQYIHRDHLGSVNVITNNEGHIVNRVYFDAFGQARSHSWQGDIVSVDDLGINIGFTGHEHNDQIETGFINMGGRIYNARIGRFLSPDAVIQSPAFGQSYNAYSYVNNNPLTFIDPTGYEVGSPGGGGMYNYGGSSGPSMNRPVTPLFDSPYSASEYGIDISQQISFDYGAGGGMSNIGTGLNSLNIGPNGSEFGIGSLSNLPIMQIPARNILSRPPPQQGFRMPNFGLYPSRYNPLEWLPPHYQNAYMGVYNEAPYTPLEGSIRRPNGYEIVTEAWPERIAWRTNRSLDAHGFWWHRLVDTVFQSLDCFIIGSSATKAIELGPKLAPAAVEEYVTVYRFADRTIPATLQSPLTAKSNASFFRRAVIRTRARLSRRYRERIAHYHMRGTPPHYQHSPFVSVGKEHSSLATSSDTWLSTIATGRPGMPGVRRAPDIGIFKVPRSRLISPRANNVLSLSETEMVFWGDDLARFNVGWIKNPY